MLPVTELQLQSKCFQWAWNTYPQIRHLIFSVPNGGTRNPIEATQLKSSGLVPGIPDILIVWPVLIGVEFKTETGTLSPAQVKVHAAWRSNGIRVEVIRSFDQWLVFLSQLFPVT